MARHDGFRRAVLRRLHVLVSQGAGQPRIILVRARHQQDDDQGVRDQQGGHNQGRYVPSNAQLVASQVVLQTLVDGIEQVQRPFDAKEPDEHEGKSKSRGRFGSTTAGTTNTMPTVRSAWSKSSAVSAAWSGKAESRGAMYQRAINAKTIRFSANWKPKI